MSSPQEFIESVNELKRLKAWAVVREMLIEARIKDYELEVMKPADTQAQMMGGERAKGAALALRGLLVPFDNILPEVKDEDDVS